MALKSFGGGGGGGGGGGSRVLQVHNATLSGGATWHWPLYEDEEAVTGGSPVDISAGSRVYVPAGPAGSLGFFDAQRSSGTYTGNVGAAAELKDALTIAAWVYRVGTVPANLDICSSRIAGAGSSNNTLWGMRATQTTSKMGFWWQNGGSDNVNLVESTAAATADTWEHYTVTRPTAGTSAKIYKNGSLDNTSGVLIKPDGGENTTSIVLGNNKAGAEWPGYLFSAIVFETEMDADAVLALYNSTSSTGSWA